MKMLAPRAPPFSVDHAALAEQLPLGALAGCPQDPLVHAEGDVATHTRMALDALVCLPAWRALAEPERETLFLAMALHNLGKPATTRLEDGRLTDAGHWHVSEQLARSFLYRAGCDPSRREQVAALVRWHQGPLLLEQLPDPRRALFQWSYVLRCDWLALLAEADCRGRVCADRARRLQAIARFTELCSAEDCLTTPRAFANDHSRIEYFRKPGRDPHYHAFDDTRLEVAMLSGLPGAGKDTWLGKHARGRPVISLDDIREELDLARSETPGQVIAAARERARGYLRAQQSFVFNATNLRREQRRGWLELFFGYGARVCIVALEVPWSELLRRNESRQHPVASDVLERLAAKWQPPDASEAHVVEHAW